MNPGNTATGETIAGGICLEIGGLAARPWLRLGDEIFFMNEGKLCRYGFDYRLTEDLFRVLTALAAARVRGEGCLSAAVVAERVNSSAGRVTSLLARALVAGRPPEGALLDYPVTESLGGGRRGGRSVGPYRISLPPRRITVDVEESDAFLAGVPVRQIALEEGAFAALQKASDMAGAGAFTKGLSLIRAALRAVDSHADDSIRGADRLMFEANAFEYMSNLQMELGRWEEGLSSAKRALELYGTKKYGHKKRLGHPEGQAHVLQIKAHLFGQAGMELASREAFYADRAYYMAFQAVKVLERSGGSGTRDRMREAVFRGVLGQRCSQGRRLQQAIRPLEHARRVAAEEGVLRWEAIWSVRIAQNAVLRKDLRVAEKEIDRALGLSSHMTVAGNAALWRARAELLIEARSWDAAEDTLNRAYDYGVSFGMEHQKREVERLRAHLRTVEAAYALKAASVSSRANR